MLFPTKHSELLSRALPPEARVARQRSDRLYVPLEKTSSPFGPSPLEIIVTGVLGFVLIFGVAIGINILFGG